jgi:N-acetyl-anhydromuramyl-L-alanine amidase AmpD
MTLMRATLNVVNINPDSLPFIEAKHYKAGRIKPVELIVVHSMEAPEKGETAENVARYFQRGSVVASAHYCVDYNSAIQCVWDRDTAYHCKNANANGVGIEHAGYAKQSEAEWLDDYGRAMLDISAQIAAYLCKKFNIPIQRAVFAGVNDPRVLQRGFTGHVDVPAHGSHWDPGFAWPWNYYLERVKAFYKANSQT